MTDALRDRVRGCLVGVALGDAIGMPWEMCFAEEIAQATGGRGVQGLEDLPAGHARRLTDTRGIALGETTDDWQLTRAVAESLIRCKGFDLHDQALAHVEAFETSTKGWGRSTRRAMAEFKAYFESRGREGRRPGVPAPDEADRGRGNGVLMKIAPLACWHTRPGKDIEKDVSALVSLSHHEAVSLDVAWVMRSVLLDFLGSDLTGSVLEALENEALAEDLRALFGQRGVLWLDPTAEEVRKACGTSCNAFSSASFCLATFLRNPICFRKAVLEAINAGGDTDTNASIVGALVGANLGLEAVLEEASDWFDAVLSAEEAVDVADRLVDAARAGGEPS